MKVSVFRFLLVAVIIAMTASTATARGNGFSIGVTPIFSVGKTDDRGNKPEFWSIGATGGYTLNFGKFFFLNPEASLYVENINRGFGGIPGTTGDAKSGTNFGGSLAASLGVNFGAGIEAFTGPWASCNFSLTGPSHYERDYRRASAYWRIGLGYTLWRFTLRASFNIRMTERTNVTRANTVGLGLYYNF